MQTSFWKALLQHGAAVILFVGLALLFCSPLMEGKELFQSDMIHFQGMEKEAVDHYKATGEIALWTNSMFSGMPTYVINTGPSVNKLTQVNRFFTLYLPNPADMFFISMLGMYVLLSVIDFRWWIRIMGAIAYGFATFSIVSMEVGHITKVMSMAYMAPVLGGIILTYHGKWLGGGALTALAAALMIYNNHPQIVYYTLILVGCMVVGIFIRAFRRKELPDFFKASLILLIAGIFAVLPAMDNLLLMKEYTNYSIRGSQSELTTTGKQKPSQGLDIGYAFQWSYGPGETFTLLLPRLVGGASAAKLPVGSHTYKALLKMGVTEQQATDMIGKRSWPVYWASQPGTSGPVYVGAVICFLFVLALLIIKDSCKWWLLAATVIAVILSWGANFPAVNNFLFYHLPLYNKFRSPTMALVIPQVTFVILACWALQVLITTDQKKELLLDALKNAVYITGGLVVVLAFLGAFTYSFSAPGDAYFVAQYTKYTGSSEAANSLLAALKKDRSNLLAKDGIRALVFIFLAYAALWAYLKGKLKAVPVMIGVAVLVLIDLFQVGKDYMSEDSFVDADRISGYNAPSPADVQILKDKTLYYRVLNNTANPWLDASTPYLHKSIGGQSPAKLWIYQDLIEHQLSKKNRAVLNMLNTRYFIEQKNGQPVAIQNPDALGNAWFVKGIQWEPSANAEMMALDHFNPADTVVIDQRFKKEVGDLHPAADSNALIQLTKYSPNALTFTATNNHDGLAVFSDIYYPAGWHAFIDGKETNIIRVNYALRGLKIPAGKHDVAFKFEPATFFLGRKISAISSVLLIILVALGFAGEYYMQRYKKEKG